MTDTAILGLGNLILGDDGVGIQVVERLQEKDIKNIDVIDGGTAGFGLLNILEMYDKLIVVDALNFGGEKGEVSKLNIEDIKELDKINISAHDLDFVDAVKVASELGNVPEIVVFGIEVGYVDRTEVTMELTPEVEESIDKIIRLIEKEINK
ncbi:hydrogenase maturation protease [Methanonatronarchaeum sp. AMET6-2]|uniref:hydrogenase maturation protease n=1 Tax=Methanonatronarchaeum sp. AMET6-2 TaxID=2933293 RepID=UPI001213FAC8|nr:hydrogenase maturation protease [Methanonatronarchaeum sp. AMET6-2]RZN60956.1 MAG: hydrogenase maturation protease [Methanonatronarchaeia archaeon]UOY10650.1 hydrogenase maturation protease [Methanonatronarchaeum sp. AMET6-2]